MMDFLSVWDILLAFLIKFTFILSLLRIEFLFGLGKLILLVLLLVSDLLLYLLLNSESTKTSFKLLKLEIGVY